MEFLQSCAARLDKGAPAESVLAEMRKRYSTAACMKVKTCLVRGLCAWDSAFYSALEASLASVSVDDRSRVRDTVLAAVRASRSRTGDASVDSVLATLPPHLPLNVRQLHVTAAERTECKKRARVARLCKNHRRTRVDGVRLLETARSDLTAAQNVADLALALMVLTGRRQCEVLSGSASFEPAPPLAEGASSSPYAASFTGQAKRKDDAPHTYTIPLLERYDAVRAAYERLRELQGGALLTKDETSRRYQSLLSRRLLAREGTYASAGHPHGLRGAYACMALRAFEWGEMSDSFVTMCILGHRDLDESLVYTTFDVGSSFAETYGGTLGGGLLTARALSQKADDAPATDVAPSVV